MKSFSFINQQQGSSTLKVIIFILVLALAANAGIRYFAVAYDCEDLKSEMKAAVFLGQASGMGNETAQEQARQRIKRAMVENGAPANAYMDVWSEDGQMYSRVAFTTVVHLVPLGVYDYKYVFDETVTPAGFVPKASPGK